MLNGNFQLFTLQWVGGALADPDILRRVFHSQQVPPAGFNRGHYSNPEVDRLIDVASRGATDESERKRVLRRGAEAHRGGRAVHSDLEPGERDPGAAGYGSVHLPPTGDFAPLRNATKGAAAGN